MYLYFVENLHRCETEKCLMLRVCRPTGFMSVLNFGYSSLQRSHQLQNILTLRVRINMAPTIKWVPNLASYFYHVCQSARCLTDFFQTRYDIISITLSGTFGFALVYLIYFSLIWPTLPPRLSESFNQVPINLRNLIMLSVHFAIHISLILIRV